MAEKRPASEALVPTPAVKRSRTSMAQKRTIAKRTPSAGGKEDAQASTKPNQTAQASRKNQASVPKQQKKTVPAERKRSASFAEDEPVPIKKRKSNATTKRAQAGEDATKEEKKSLTTKRQKFNAPAKRGRPPRASAINTEQSSTEEKEYQPTNNEKSNAPRKRGRPAALKPTVTTLEARNEQEKADIPEIRTRRTSASSVTAGDDSEEASPTSNVTTKRGKYKAPSSASTAGKSKPVSRRRGRSATLTSPATAPEEEHNTPVPASDNQSTTKASAVTASPEASRVSPASPVYNFEFFQDMAETIASNFPFAEFAARHFCSVNEVARALSAVVIAPLADPSFDWYDDDDLTIPTYAIVMMESWERHYQRALTANVEQVVSDDTTETSSSSSWDSDGVNGQYDGSFSESGSDVLTTRSGKSSTSSSGSSTGSGGHGNSPNNGISISATIFKIDCEGEDALNHHVQEGEDSDTIEDSHASDETSEGEMEEPTRVAVRDTEYKKRPKWMPVDRPRVHVYKDEWGAYVPVPTKEEKEEQERQQMLKEEARRIRRSRGRMKEDDSEELDMLELELEMALGENFGDQDLEVDQDLRRAIQDSYPPLGGVNLRGERVDENGVEWPPEYDLV